MLAELPVREWNSGLVHEARPHVLHLMRGEVFDIDGLTVLAMGGAASNDRQYRREGRSWWPEEMPSSTDGSATEPGSSGITTATNGATPSIA